MKQPETLHTLKSALILIYTQESALGQILQSLQVVTHTSSWNTYKEISLNLNLNFTGLDIDLCDFSVYLSDKTLFW